MGLGSFPIIITKLLKIYLTNQKSENQERTKYSIAPFAAVDCRNETFKRLVVPIDSFRKWPAVYNYFLVIVYRLVNSARDHLSIQCRKKLKINGTVCVCVVA